MTKDIATWFQSAVLKPTPMTAIECRPMVCLQLIHVPPIPVDDLHLVRQRYERLASEMASVLTEAIARASWNSAHRDWLLDAEDACVRTSLPWYGLKQQADCLGREAKHRGWELNSRKVQPLSHEERDVIDCISAIRNAARALRDLEAAERHEYERQLHRRSR